MIRMIGAFTRWWGDTMHLFPDAQTEVEMHFGDLSGHCDIIAVHEGVCRIPDVKTTRLEDVDYLPQGKDYMKLASEDPRFKHAERFQFIPVFVRDWSVIVSDEYTKAELDNWHRNLEARILNWDGKTYCPSGACWYCGRCATCPGLQRQIQQTHNILSETEDIEGVIAAMTGQQKVELWDKIGLAQKLLDHARTLIKLEAVANDMVLAGETRSLVITEQIRHPLKPLQAWPILTQYLSDAELAPAVKISKTVALAAIAAKAPKRQGAKAKRQVTAELEAAGAFGEQRILFPRIKPALGAANEKQIEGS